MVRALDELEVVLESRATDTFLVDKDCGEAALDAFFYLLLEDETLDASIVTFRVVVARRKNVEIHLSFDAPAVEDVS